MLYIIADTQAASRQGFSGGGYPTANGLTCINEKDFLTSQTLEGDLRQRAEAIGGRIVSRGEALEAMKQESRVRKNK